MEEPQSRGHSRRNSAEGFPQDRDAEGKGEGKEGPQNQDSGLKVLPFEFVALEACLEAACSCLENEVLFLPCSGFSCYSLPFACIGFLFNFIR